MPQKDEEQDHAMTPPEMSPAIATTEASPRPDRLTVLRRRLSSFNPALSSFQAIAGFVTAVVSVVGAVVTIPTFFASAPAAPTMGTVVAIVEEAKTDKAITDARIEILTPQNVLITTVTPNYFGKARHSLEEGPYRVRVSHPRYAAEVRSIHVVKGQTSELHLRLRAGSSSPIDHAERVVKDGVGAVKRIFGQ